MPASVYVHYCTSTAEMPALLQTAAAAARDTLQPLLSLRPLSHKVLSGKRHPIRGWEKNTSQQGCPKRPKTSTGTGLYSHETELTRGILKYPGCLWIITPLGRYEELHLSRLFSNSGSSSSSSGGSDLLIALWKILYH